MLVFKLSFEAKENSMRKGENGIEISMGQKFASTNRLKK